MGCVQSTQFRLRIGPYQSRIGPDSACFRGSPVFAGEGMQFESHLGHSITPRQRGFCFNVWTLTLAGPSDAWPRSCLAPRWPVRLCGWRVQVPWLVSPPPAGMWGHPGLLSGCVCVAVVGLYLFMSWGCGGDMLLLKQVHSATSFALHDLLFAFRSFSRASLPAASLSVRARLSPWPHTESFERACVHRRPCLARPRSR